MTSFHFRARCREAFRFLEETFGFQGEAHEDQLVRYRKGGVLVDVRFDLERSYELETEFSLADQLEPAFSLAEVLLLHEGAMPHAVQVTSDAALRRCLDTMARQVREHAISLLTGDPAEFARLSEQRRRVFKQKQDLQQREDAVRAAQSAWRDKDYSTVVRLLEPVEARLTPSETNILHLARKRAIK